MKYRTTKCKEYNHPEFVFECDSESIPIVDIEWLIALLESEVQSGTSFSDGSTIQIGTVVIMIKLTGDNELGVYEPDFKSTPIQFIDSVTNTLRLLRRQKDVFESVHLDSFISFPSIRQSIMVTNTYQNASFLLLSRELPEENFSGWLIQDMEISESEYFNPTEDCSMVSIYEVLCTRPDLAQYLALPEGVMVHIKNNQINIIKNGMELDISQNSYLDKLMSESRKL